MMSHGLAVETTLVGCRETAADLAETLAAVCRFMFPEVIEEAKTGGLGNRDCVGNISAS